MKQAVALSTMAAFLLTGCGGTTDPAAAETQNSSAASAAPTSLATGSATASGGPAVTKSFVSPSKIDVTSEPATVEVSVQVADEDGVKPPTGVKLVNEGGAEPISATFTRVAGTSVDAAWKATLEVPSGTAAGTWEVTLDELKDTAGNVTSGDDLKIKSIEVTSTPAA